MLDFTLPLITFGQYKFTLTTALVLCCLLLGALSDIKDQMYRFEVIFDCWFVGCCFRYEGYRFFRERVFLQLGEMLRMLKQYFKRDHELFN